ncbi:hypothetical protein CEE44_00055 [Candidatus Woesearchaeota archaeon B3_Woes]|nr:MAG: hypothetical protein CEE44_00055 [Candidatus Woesearchaeota archaeon B3_Woes]
MAITPQHIAIGTLFQNQFTFQVPKYQRNFTWDENDLSDFFDDLEKCYQVRINENTRHHFFGGVVSIKQEIPGSSRQLFDLVDGQQRIATFIIFMSTIISITEELAQEADEQNDNENNKLAKERVKKLTSLYIKFKDEINRKIIEIDRLELSLPDEPFFKDLINNNSPTPERDSHNRLEYAYKFISEKLKNILNELQDIPSKLDALETFHQVILQDCTIIHIVTESKDEAYRLFQVLNDRGTCLTEGDLLKARTLELLDLEIHNAKQDAVLRRWNKIIADHPDQTEKFLRWYYSSVKGKRPSKTDLFDDFLDNFFPQHKKEVDQITGADATAILNSVNNFEKEIIIMRKLIEGDWPYSSTTQTPSWNKERLRLLIVDLKHTHCIPFLLAARKLDHHKFSEIVHLVERFFFRYKLMCNAHIGQLTKIYFEQSQLIRANPSTYDISTLRSELNSLQNSKAQDELFVTQMSAELNYNVNKTNKPLKYFLMTIEHYFKWYIEGSTGDPQCENLTRVFDFANTTIEHIYPQNATGNVIQAQLEELKHNIGNLSFLGEEDNNTGANDTFNTKKSILQTSSVLMNNKIAEKSSWDKNAVEERRDLLLDLALKVFSA